MCGTQQTHNKCQVLPVFSEKDFPALTTNTSSSEKKWEFPVGSKLENP